MNTKMITTMVLKAMTMKVIRIMTIMMMKTGSKGHGDF